MQRYFKISDIINFISMEVKYNELLKVLEYCTGSCYKSYTNNRLANEFGMANNYIVSVAITQYNTNSFLQSRTWTFKIWFTADLWSGAAYMPLPSALVSVILQWMFWYNTNWLALYCNYSNSLCSWRFSRFICYITCIYVL